MNLLFFGRGPYSNLLSLLDVRCADQRYIAYNKGEKECVKSNGKRVVACFEEAYDELSGVQLPDNYLRKGFSADRFYGWMSLDERRQLLARQIEFVRTVLHSEDVDALIHETISWDFEEVLSIEARKAGVKDVTFLPSIFENRFFLKPNPYNSSFPDEVLRSATPSAEARNQAEAFVEDVLNAGLYPDYAQPDQNYNSVDYIEKIEYAINLIKKDITKNQKKGTGKAKEGGYFYPSYFKSRTFVSYLADKISKRVNEYDTWFNIKEHDYVFFPLHVEPEAAVDYFSPVYDDQVCVIRSILKYLPNDRYLVVKGHPNQPDQLLRQKFDKLRRNNSNLVFLSSSVPSEVVIENARSVITISGSVGLESLILQKPVCVFGDVFYDKHPGVVKVKSDDDLKFFLHGEGNGEEGLESVVSYIAKVYSQTFEGSVDSDDLSKKNISLISESIHNHLKDG